MVAVRGGSIGGAIRPACQLVRAKPIAPAAARPAAPDQASRQAADQVARQFEDPALAEAMARLALNIATKRHRNHRKDFPC